VTPRSAIGLGVDAGQGATRWALADSTGAVLAAGEAEPFTGHLFTPEARAALGEVMRRLTDNLPPDARPWAAVLGVTGLSAGTPAAEFVRQTAAAALALPAIRVQVHDDMRIAHLAAFGDSPGVLVYAGTGAAAYALDARGRAVRAGGHGYLLDDAGGGFWIGREGLRALLRSRDETPTAPAGELARRLDAALGGPDWERIREAIYAGGGREKLAALAPEVLAAAEAGDPLAAEVIDRAGRELGRLAAIVIRRAKLQPPVRVAFLGGAARTPLAEALAPHLPPGCQPAPQPELKPAEAAARLAAAHSTTGKGAQVM
jgi:N-acetylglucosamine kinase-like BadF-type ATPase